MTRHTFIAILIITACMQLQGQKVELMFTSGMAGYSMRDLKTTNDDLQSQIPFSTKLTANFPMTFQFGGHFAVQLSNLYKIGVLYTYNSTGSRITSSDYSGSYYYDNIVTGNTIGILNGFRLYAYKAFRVDLQANIGIVASILKITEELNVADTTFTSAVHYSAVGMYLEPSMEISYQWKHLKGGIYLGYFLNPMGRIRNESGQKSSSTINWSGLRFGIEIGIRQANRTTGPKAGHETKQ